MDDTPESILKKILADEEFSQINSETTKKLDTYFNTKLDEYMKAKAVYEAGRATSESKIKTLESEVTDLKSQQEVDRTNIKALQQNISELETQTSLYRSEISKLHDACTRAENDQADFRRQRDAAIDERDDVLKIVERRTMETERLQSEVTTLTEQLRLAIDAKCEALAKLDEVAGLKMSFEYKEHRMDQERTLLNNQIQNLNEDLARRIEELFNMRREHTTRLITLQTNLDEKSDELRVNAETIETLTDANSELSARVESLTERLREQRDNEAKYHESFSQELQAQTKLAELYRSMCDENKMQTEQLSAGISELQRLLKDASEQYGELESKYKDEHASYEEIIVKKNECIEILKQELEEANELLKCVKEQKIENVVENLAPTAAATSRLIKSGMSVTQIYSQYVSASSDLILKDAEIKRLNSYIDTILQELEEKAPMLRKQREDYEIAIEDVNQLTQQNDHLLNECQNLREEIADANKNAGHHSRENERLRRELADLSRQVCYLLKEVEELRSASVSSHENDTSTSDYHSSSDIISKRLVTFADIEELQSNNQKLLALVRELSTKQEEAESIDPVEAAELKSKLETMRENQSEMLEAQERQTKMLGALIRQRDMYKKLYQNSVRNIEQDLPMNVDLPDDIIDPKPDTSIKISSVEGQTSFSISKEVEELQLKLSDTQKQLNVVREEYENYRKERNTNEKMLNEQIDSLRTENRTLTQSNCKLTSLSEYNDEKFKVLKTNVDIYKKQIDGLEKKCDIYNTTIVKHEQTIMHLKDEILNAQSQVARSEVQLENLKHENKLLKESEARLIQEREALNRETRGQNLLLNNLESIKASIERNEAEGRIRLESRLDEASRECAALRRRLQEEQDRFRELSSHLERQMESLKQRTEEEKSQTEKVQKELNSVREELVTKSNRIEELNKKLKYNLVSNKSDAAETKAVKELENRLSESELQIKTLQQQLKATKDHADQYCQISENSEKELKELQDLHEQYKQETGAKLAAYEKLEQELRKKIGMLEEEISLESSDQHETTIGLRNQLFKLKENHERTLEELNSTKTELEMVKEDLKKFTETVHNTEEKYAREMLLHSSDIQALGHLKEEISKVIGERDILKQEKEEAIEALNLSKESWQKREKTILADKEDIQRRIEELDTQNTILHNQIEELSTQLSIAHAKQGSADVSADQSQDISMNKSLTEDEIKSSDQLLQIIKFLRREKDISITKFDIVHAENSRLKSLNESLQKQLEEVKSALSNAREKVDIEIVTSNKHSEVLRKVETLNAITDSNRILREERDALQLKVQELMDRISKVEEELAPLQEKNKELTNKAEALQSENTSLRAEATRWRQRANLLIEKSNKTSPEDWRRLQTERENLAKIVMSEKENVKKANEMKTRAEQQVSVLQRQHQLQQDQLKKQNDELNTIKQQITKVTQELQEARTSSTKQKEELTEKDNEIASKNKEFKALQARYISVRNLAKKMKATEEANAVERNTLEERNIAEAKEQVREEANEKISALEKTHDEKLKELTAQVTSSREEAENLRKENEQIRNESSLKYERFQLVLRSSKIKLQNMYETNDTLTREIADLRSRVDSQDDSDSRIVALKSQFENTINRLEKEKSEAIAERRHERERLNREIETLNQRLAQLQRQLSSQSKPSTSSGPVEKSTSEPPTANIKPMAGQTQQSVGVSPRRAGETPFASIRPMSMPSRTVTVFPQNVNTSGPSTAVLVPPQQQIVHTTGSNSVEALSSSPTSSHTDYMPATSSASPAVIPIRQLAVPPTQQATITIGIGAREETPSAAESTQDMEAETAEQESQPITQQTQQAVALVLPRVETQSDNQQQSAEHITSGMTQTQVVASSQPASSSNTVTTTQAGLKRTRETEGDSSTSSGQDEQGKIQPQAKRTRMQPPGQAEVFQGVTESGIEIEYQVPTSSQRDQEDDIIVVDSEDDEEEEGPDEGVEVLEEPDDGPYGEGDNPEECYETDGLVYDQEQELTSYDDADCQALDEENTTEADNNEVEIIEESTTAPDGGSSNVASQSGSGNSVDGQGDKRTQTTGAQSEAISSGSSDGPSGVTMSQAAPSMTHPFAHRGRNVTPLSRQQQSHLLLPHGYEESGGDDGIVPSTPTLYVPRRTDGFGEAVSSPHVPSGGRFTFNDAPQTSSGRGTVPQVQSEGSTSDETRVEQAEDSGTGRSVPTTPLQVSPQGEQIPSDTGEIIPNEEERSCQDSNIERPNIRQQAQGESSGNIPEITVTGASGAENSSITEESNQDDAEADAQQGMAPPISGDTAGPSEEVRSQINDDNIVIEVDEGTDGVSSEGEKPEIVDEVEMEEGREAEASQSPSSMRGRTLARRSPRFRAAQTRAHRPTPIVWNDQSRGSQSRGNRGMHQSSGPQMDAQMRGAFQRGQRLRRNMRRPPQNNFMRY